MHPSAPVPVLLLPCILSLDDTCPAPQPLLPACSTERAAALEARLKEAEAALRADRLALQLEQQRVTVAEEKAASALAAAQEQAARADAERAWVRQQQEELTPRLESSSAAHAEAKQRARELAAQAEEQAREQQRLQGERAALERLRAQLEASQVAADRALAQVVWWSGGQWMNEGAGTCLACMAVSRRGCAGVVLRCTNCTTPVLHLSLVQAADVAAKEAALAAKERGVIELEAALKLREARLTQVRRWGA